MKNPFRKMSEMGNVYISPLDSGEMIAFGESEAIAFLGETVGHIPGPLARTVRLALTASEELAEVAQDASCVVLRLTAESQDMFLKHDAVYSNGAMLGVLRGGDGKFIHQLQFVRTTAQMSSALPGLISGLAVQYQLVTIEKKLDQLQLGIDYLAEEMEAEVDAELKAAIGILADVYRSVMNQVEITDDHWEQIANVELSVKAHNERTREHMMALRHALENSEASISERVERLGEVIEQKHASSWLKLHIRADRAATQWDELHLLRQITQTPEMADVLSADTERSITARREAMSSLTDCIANYLAVGANTDGFVERLRIFKRARNHELLSTLDQMLRAYGGSSEDSDHDLISTQDIENLTAWDILMTEFKESGSAGKKLSVAAFRSSLEASAEGLKTVKKSVWNRRGDEEE